FSTTNIATDHNQLIMEIMQKVAKKHDMVCLLHEKPFKGVSGSGKHNNWSISTKDGMNLLEPGETPYDNAQFLLFLCAVIKAVDNYQDLLRISVASAGNDHRLGAGEAPPAIVSMFLGDELNAILESIENDTAYDAKEAVQMKVGVHVLPRFPKDTTDRNRTSPFAFTGNKFEFRMLGSASSISSANIALNTAVAESLKSYADRLENVENFEEALHALIKKTIKDHKRIIFNGNGYDDEWIKEAEKRGLSNLRTTPDCLPALISEKSVELFGNHKVFTREELEARYEIYLENYCKTLNIEALTVIDMVNKDILPAISRYIGMLSESAVARKSVFAAVDCSYEEKTVAKLSALSNSVFDKIADFEDKLEEINACSDKLAVANMYKDIIIPAMEDIRADVDAAESITAAEYWPYPSYGDLLFSVQ
ncbi:MAG: glutamine synthetase type III, partial [Clostridia bacterium]|nr:glutamine synthetase type III [Clostridia bacterium]